MVETASAKAEAVLESVEQAASIQAWSVPADKQDQKDALLAALEQTTGAESLTGPESKKRH